MAIETFQWCPSLESGDPETTFSSHGMAAGDGYVVATNEGINPRRITFPFKLKGSWAEAKAVQDFLDRHAGVRSFMFTPPYGRQGYYYAPAGYVGPRSLGGDNAEISCVLVQTFRP